MSGKRFFNGFNPKTTSSVTDKRQDSSGLCEPVYCSSQIAVRATFDLKIGV